MLPYTITGLELSSKNFLNGGIRRLILLLKYVLTVFKIISQCTKITKKVSLTQFSLIFYKKLDQHFLRNSLGEKVFK